MLQAGGACAPPALVQLLLGRLLHQSRFRNVSHCNGIVNRTHCNVREVEAIRCHAVDQQLGAPVVLAVVEPESPVGLEDRQERTVDPCLGLAGVEDVHRVLLVGSQKGRALANTAGEKAVGVAALGRCDASIPSVVTMCGEHPTGASVTGTAGAVAAAAVAAGAVAAGAVAAAAVAAGAVAAT